MANTKIKIFLDSRIQDSTLAPNTVDSLINMTYKYSAYTPFVITTSANLTSQLCGQYSSGLAIVKRIDDSRIDYFVFSGVFQIGAIGYISLSDKTIKYKSVGGGGS